MSLQNVIRECYFKQVQGMDFTVHKLHPFTCLHMHIQGVLIGPALVATYK